MLAKCTLQRIDHLAHGDAGGFHVGLRQIKKSLFGHGRLRLSSLWRSVVAGVVQGVRRYQVDVGGLEGYHALALSEVTWLSYMSRGVLSPSGQ